MSEPSALTPDWKLDTIKRIAEDHKRRGLPYYTDGLECEKRLKEAHGDYQEKIESKNIKLGVSDAVQKVDVLDGG